MDKTISTYPRRLLKGSLCLYAVTCIALLQPAQAQTLVDAGQTPTPPETQLNQSGASIPAVQPTQQTTVSPAMAVTATPAAADLCPNPAQALGTPMRDMVQVQSDIERLSLCAQRAQLLERLSESAAAEKETVKNALGLNIPAELKEAALAKQNKQSGTDLMMPQGLQPLPADILAGADVGATQGGISPTGANIVAVPEKPKSWQIKEIFGATDKIQARILSPEGNEAVVRRGARLKGGFIVTDITPSAVTISKGKTTESLEWATN